MKFMQSTTVTIDTININMGVENIRLMAGIPSTMSWCTHYQKPLLEDIDGRMWAIPLFIANIYLSIIIYLCTVTACYGTQFLLSVMVIDG